MHKSELIKSTIAITGCSVKDTEATLDALLEVITSTLKKGEEVALIGFGTFKTHKRKAREGKNPRTGAKMQIPAKTAPRFTPGSKLVKAVG